MVAAQWVRKALGDRSAEGTSVMEDDATGWWKRGRRFALVVFLFVYLPLDAFDADTFDTFEAGVVQVRVEEGNDAVHSALHPMVAVPEAPLGAVALHAVAPASDPICTLPVTRKPFSLPRSDDPHVTSSQPAKSTAYPLIV